MSWRKGQDIYDKLVSNLAEYISEQRTDIKAIELARTVIPDFVNGLTIKDLISIHEYLMYMTEMRSDSRFPVYVYTGGDRIISVTRYLTKYIDLELAKQYA